MLLFVITYVPDHYKTQHVCDKAILEIVEHQSLFLTATNQQIGDNAVDNYSNVLESVPEWYNTQIKCVIKLLILLLLELNMFLIDLRLKKYVIKPLINVPLWFCSQ